MPERKRFFSVDPFPKSEALYHHCTLALYQGILVSYKCHKDDLLYVLQKIQNLKESYSQAMESQYDVCIEDLFNQVS